MLPITFEYMRFKSIRLATAVFLIRVNRHAFPLCSFFLQGGCTPLYAAAVHGNKAVVEALLAAKALPDPEINKPDEASNIVPSYSVSEFSRSML